MDVFCKQVGYGTPRCAKESLNNNQGAIYVLHKGTCEIYNLGFIKLLLSFLIVAQTVAIMWFFYYSLAMEDQKQVGQGAQNLGGKAIKKTKNTADATRKAASAARNATVKTIQKVYKKPKKENIMKQKTDIV